MRRWPMIVLVASATVAASLSAPTGARAGSTILVPADGTSLGPIIAGLSQRIPLILVPGLFDNQTQWEPLQAVHAATPGLRDKYKIYLFRYPTLPFEVEAGDPQTLDAVGQALGDELVRLGLWGLRLVILGYSQGGLVARAFMQNYEHDGLRGGDLVLRLITLATPHHGTPLADHDLFDALSDQTYLDDLRWDNFDGNTFGSHDNEWLQCLNMDAGRCSPDRVLSDGLGLDRMFVLGANARDNAGAYQVTDLTLLLGAICLAHPGVLQCPGTSGVNPPYLDNDGAMPVESALFDGAPRPLAGRFLFAACDHLTLRRDQCSVAGESVYPRALGPSLHLTTDKTTYLPGEAVRPILDGIPTHAGPDAPVGALVAVRASDSGSLLFLGPDGVWGTGPTAAAQGIPFAEIPNRLASWVDSAPGIHLAALALLQNDELLDYSYVLYTVLGTESPP